MPRISSAFRSFFSILFSGVLPADVASEFGFVKPQPVAAQPAAPQVKASDGALQFLYILQRDSRFIDFLMEDISEYSDEQVGAAVRALHAECKASLMRHLTLTPIVDSVEGAFHKLDSSKAPDPSRIKLVGNVPASGKVAGGTLRHRGWFVSAVDLPVVGSRDVYAIAPAEIEVE